MKQRVLVGCVVFVLFSLGALSASADHGARFLLSPATGTFTVGSTFDVSLLIDTNNNEANAIAVFLDFPPEKLQVVSSSAGKSVIDLWSVPPRFNNQAGTIELQGVVTSGLNATNALITTVTFRVKGIGTANIRITDGSRVLRHDGNGTDYLQHRRNALFTLALPPPAGPNVVSETHPDQQKWYRESNISLVWSLPEVSSVGGYSYMLNAMPVDIPDNVSEGIDQSVIYQQISEGTKYFHIKALRGGIWGGTTHFAVNIDTTPPADFPVEVNPGTRTSETQPIVRFITTDALSGIDHYELKIISLNPSEEVFFLDQPLFIEVGSPYVLPKLEHGKYDVLIRAYDEAGNFREVVQRITIRDVFFGLASNEGFEVDGWFVIPWSWLLIILLVLLAGLGYETLQLYHREREIENGTRKGLPPTVRDKLGELKKYRDKYGKISLIILFFGAMVFGGDSVAYARELKVEPPLISTVSRGISNQDIFYVGGKTNVPNSLVEFFLQNLTTGETGSFQVSSNEYGDWFYTHDAFLSSGDYLLWAQSRVGDNTSPPSPQVTLFVRPTAVQFGASRLAYDIVYQVALLLLLVVVGVLTMMIIQGRRRLRGHQERIMKEIREAEDAVHRGFAVLRRDIQRELEIIGKTKMSRELQMEEEKREADLLADLEGIEGKIGKEILDIELLEE